MRIEEKKWQKLVVAYRDVPGNHKNACRFAECDRGTARKAWAIGWPESGKKAIQAILQEEEEAREAKAQAKAEMVKTEMDAFAASLRGDVRAQALEEYERTNRFLRAASATATAVLAEAHRLMPVVRELGEVAPKLVEMVKADIELGTMNAMQAMMLLDKIANFAKTVTATTNSATLQGAKVFEVTRARSSMDAIINIDKALSEEAFDPVEAKRLAAELAEAALEVEQFDAEGRPVLNVIAGEGGREEEDEEERPAT